jgi:hypothetical protein
MYCTYILFKYPYGEYGAGILKQSMGAGNRVGIGLSYLPARLHRLAEFIPRIRFLGSINVQKYGLRIHIRTHQKTSDILHTLQLQKI